MKIIKIISRQQTFEEIDGNNYFIIIKILIENKYCLILRYNLVNEKEYSSFDCSIRAEPLFDNSFNCYLLDDDTIIDWQ